MNFIFKKSTRRDQIKHGQLTTSRCLLRAYILFPPVTVVKADGDFLEEWLIQPNAVPEAAEDLTAMFI